MQLKLNPRVLHQKFISAVENFVENHSDLDLKPLDLDCLSPLPRKMRLYIYNTTHPPGGRTMGEHKIQLIVPGQTRGQRASFDHSDGRIVLLCGFQSELDIFVLWDSSLYRNFPFSRNVQVKAETIYEAFSGKIGKQPRLLRTDQGTMKEIVLTSKSRLLKDTILLRVNLTIKSLVNI